MSSFQSVPILDYSLSLSPTTKPQFLTGLRNALLEVGFLYIKNTGIDDGLIAKVIELGKKFFDLPEEEKLSIEMKNCRCSVFLFRGWLSERLTEWVIAPHFLGYSRLGNEM